MTWLGVTRKYEEILLVVSDDGHRCIGGRRNSSGLVGGRTAPVRKSAHF